MADISPHDALGVALGRWQRAGIISAAQADAIRQLERANPSFAPAAPPAQARVRLNPATLIVYIGAFLVAVASIVFVALGWDDMGHTEQFMWGTLAVAVPWGAAYLLWRTGQQLAVQGSIGLIVLGNLALLLFFYTLFRLTGWWPDRPDLPRNQDTTRNLMTLNLGITAAVAALIAFWMQFPFMLLIGGVLGWQAWIGFIDGLRTEGSAEPSAWTTAIYGLILIAVGLVLTRLHLRQHAFWLFLVGLAVSFLFFGIDAYDNPLGATGLLFLVMALAAIAISLWLEFRVFLIFGAIGLYGWISALVIETFGGSRPVALLLIVLGAVIVATGLGWQRWVEPRLRERRRSRLPTTSEP